MSDAAPAVVTSMLPVLNGELGGSSTTGSSRAGLEVDSALGLAGSAQQRAEAEGRQMLLSSAAPGLCRASLVPKAETGICGCAA